MEWLKEGLRDWYLKIVDFLSRQFVAIRDWIVGGVKEILKGIWSIVDFVIKMVWDFFYYLYDLLFGEEGFVWYIFDVALEWGDWFITEVLPDFSDLSYFNSIDFAMVWVGRLNDFFPLTEAGVLLGVYCGFMAIFLMCRLVLKLFPGLGG